MIFWIFARAAPCETTRRTDRIDLWPLAAADRSSTRRSIARRRRAPNAAPSRPCASRAIGRDDRPSHRRDDGGQTSLVSLLGRTSNEMLRGGEGRCGRCLRICSCAGLVNECQAKRSPRPFGAQRVDRAIGSADRAHDHNARDDRCVRPTVADSARQAVRACQRGVELRHSRGGSSASRKPLVVSAGPRALCSRRRRATWCRGGFLVAAHGPVS